MCQTDAKHPAYPDVRLQAKCFFSVKNIFWPVKPERFSSDAARRATVQSP